MKAKKHLKILGLDHIKIGMSLFSNKKTYIILTPTGKGRSYSPFFIKHNIMGKTNAEQIIRLKEIIEDENIQRAEKEKAKRILHNLEFKQS